VDVCSVRQMTKNRSSNIVSVSAVVLWSPRRKSSSRKNYLERTSL